MKINAENMSFHKLNDEIRNCMDKDIFIEGCIGQRFIGCGAKDKNIKIYGVPGNAMGAYLDGANITVMGNVQDAAGDTMNDGIICVHGSSGDAVGYAMRGGAIYVRGNVGYRAGVHMKSYMEQKPVLVIGGCAGSFLGEYLAGGRILVMNLEGKRNPVGHFCGTGMHRGKIYIRGEFIPDDVPKQVCINPVSENELEEIKKYTKQYCEYFGGDPEEIMKAPFHVLKPDRANPYRQMYVSI